MTGRQAVKLKPQAIEAWIGHWLCASRAGCAYPSKLIQSPQSEVSFTLARGVGWEAQKRQRTSSACWLPDDASPKCTRENAEALVAETAHFLLTGAA